MSFPSIRVFLLLFVLSIVVFEVDSSRKYYHKTNLFIRNDKVEVRFTHCPSGIAHTQESELVSGTQYWLTMFQR